MLHGCPADRACNSPSIAWSGREFRQASNCKEAPEENSPERMLTGYEVAEREELERSLVKQVAEIEKVVAQFPKRATKAQRPPRVAVDKVAVVYYLRKQRRLLVRLRRVPSFEVSDIVAQNEAYRDVQHVGQWICHNMKFDWKNRDARDAQDDLY